MSGRDVLSFPVELIGIENGKLRVEKHDPFPLLSIECIQVVLGDVNLKLRYNSFPSRSEAALSLLLSLPAEFDLGLWAMIICKGLVKIEALNLFVESTKSDLFISSLFPFDPKEVRGQLQT